MADQDGRHSEMVTQLLCHVTSSSAMRTSKEIFSSIQSTLQASLSQLLHSRSQGGGRPPGRRRPKKPGLNRVNEEKDSRYNLYYPM